MWQVWQAECKKSTEKGSMSSDRSSREHDCKEARKSAQSGRCRSEGGRQGLPSDKAHAESSSVGGYSIGGRGFKGRGKLQHASEVLSTL